MSFFDGRVNQPQTKPVLGDVIATHRWGGVYDHYGVYKDDNCVYEYAGSEGDSGDVCVRISTLEKFISDSKGFFVVPFSERYADFAASRRALMPRLETEPAVANSVGALVLQVIEQVTELDRAGKYHLYTPEETIQRAHSELGKREYNLICKNCEHFAIWCKTGLSDSQQVNAVLTLFRPLAEEVITRMLDPSSWNQLDDAVSSLRYDLTDFFDRFGK